MTGPRSLGQLAQRVTAWTTRGLITGMLLVAALGFGREVLHWWHGEAAQHSQPTHFAGPLGDLSAPHILEFGEQGWSIRREKVSGSPGEISTALVAACRAEITDARPGVPSADAAERELLKRLAGEKPVAENHGQWRLYQWGKGQSVLIGTRATGDDKAAQGTILDETAFRVVIWGVAVPVAANGWTLYVFQAGGSASPPGQGSAEIPLPPGAVRLLAIRAAGGGGSITAFSLEDGLAARGFYDRSFAEQGWTAAMAWRQIATGWHARFESRSGVPDSAVDIRLGIDGQGRWSGLVMESELLKGKP